MNPPDRIKGNLMKTACFSNVDERADWIKKQLDAGNSRQSIADALGIHKHVVNNVIYRYGLIDGTEPITQEEDSFFRELGIPVGRVRSALWALPQGLQDMIYKAAIEGEDNLIGAILFLLEEELKKNGVTFD